MLLVYHKQTIKSHCVLSGPLCECTVMPLPSILAPALTPSCWEGFLAVGLFVLTLSQKEDRFLYCSMWELNCLILACPLGLKVRIDQIKD